MSAVEDFIFSFPKGPQSVMLFLHELLLEHPEMTTKIRYKIPFYYRKSWICYLNPSKADQKGRVELVFLRGNELSNAQGLLEAKGRKQVMGISFESVDEIPLESLNEVLQEAILLDETVPYASKRKK